MKTVLFYHTIILVITQVLPYQNPNDDTKLTGRIITRKGNNGDIHRILHLHQIDVDIHLKAVNTLVSPRYSLWLRNGNNVSVHRTIPFPTCLYSGEFRDNSFHIQASVSLCTDETIGVLEINGKHHLLELNSIRKKRESDEPLFEKDKILVVRETKSDHTCGVNMRNRKRLKVEPKPIIKLEGQVFPSANDSSRAKRSTSEYYIELSVFVDEKMYSNIDRNKKVGEDTLQKIQTLVYGYLNGVQIIYKSDRLTRRLKIVLVRLDILQTPATSLENHDGETEKYLDSFCKWQMEKNPGGNTDRADITNDEHWDHALLLTGYNLYDGLPSQDAVIGLAWVSGMCHPQYSCTINEGNNFESVFVIAHEMGHNLGMNHDGEIGEGNSCSSNKYLMSPVLGPGKVTWSKCSDQELTDFLTGSFSRTQAACLNDVPSGSLRYDFTFDGSLPGERFKSSYQCHQAYGVSYVPYVRDESPFEDLCRELWCSNLTHALRAHPALEGTDCSSKPFPYGSICKEGVCTPFRPDQGEDNKNLEPVNTADNTPTKQDDYNEYDYQEVESNAIDGAPGWYDQVYNKIFTELRVEYQRRNPVLLAASKSKDRLISNDSTAIKVNNAVDNTTNIAVNATAIAGGHFECPVKCGEGWIRAFNLCTTENELGCNLLEPCGIIPCL